MKIRPTVIALAAVAVACAVVPAAFASGATTATGAARTSDLDAQVRLVVAYTSGAGTAGRALERSLGGRRVDVFPALRLVVVEVARNRAASALTRLRAAPDVRFADPERQVEAAGRVAGDPLWPTQWSLARAGLPEAWSRTTGSPGVIVAVLDTGVDGSHPDLAAKLVPGVDVVNGDADPADDHGHGTAVAGIVGAAADDRAGMASACWRCSVMPVKVLGSDGSGSDVHVAAGIVWAVDHGARVVNLSLGGPHDSHALAGAVAYARDRGVVVVAAAGNDGSTGPSYPAAYPGVVSVGASDEADVLYPWSNSGDWVALAAPGTTATTGRGGGYVSFTGTSASAPLVAGIAGLALSAAPATAGADAEGALSAGAHPVLGVRDGRIDGGRVLAAVAPPPVRTVRTGAVGPGRRSQAVAFRAGAGAATLRLASRSRDRLVVRLYAPGGRLLASAGGKRSFRLEARLPETGAVRVVVETRAARRVPFRLELTAPAA